MDREWPAATQHPSLASTGCGTVDKSLGLSFSTFKGITLELLRTKIDNVDELLSRRPGV